MLGIDGFASFAQNQNQNQNAVGTSLDNWINGGGFNQSFYDFAELLPASLSGALTQLSGEVLTQGAPAAFQDMGAFLGGMLDPWGGANGMRGGDFGSGFGAGFGAPAMAGSGAPYASTPYGSAPYGGYGSTPYAAFQIQRWSLPAYDETAATGANVFAPSVATRTAADQHGEFGLWADRLVDTRHGRLLVRGRIAWKHSWSELPVIDAAFQALPGSSFTVTGASPDALAASLASELRIAGGWSVATKFDGEFTANSQSYGGSATLRYQW